ncbi:MAG TPA: type II toxin-antitoxin system prevent-host-death family antitoxin [Nitrolancea sp.]|nr:type II toxin-antitoxin system prevent-host-death family antitoxin [Nitrolancea sp.]
MNWQLADAKNRFSELVTQALTIGPQRVRRRDEVVVVLSEAEYQRLTGERVSLKDAILRGPDLSDLDLRRDASSMRETQW